jgi:hypothetical protein
MRTESKIGWKAGLLLLIIFNFSCSKKIITNAQPASEEFVQIQVGTKSISTNKFTNKNIPVVPMWKAEVPSTDLRNGAGFPVLNQAEHTMVWQPAIAGDGAYNHYACLIYYKGKFFAMWGNHSLGEDAPGQRVLFTRSDEWGKWKDAKELFPAPGPVKPRSEKGIHLKPDRWAIVDDILYAITYVHGAGIYPIARSVDESGKTGDPFLIQSLPSNGHLPEFMMNLPNRNIAPPVAANILNWYTQNNQISWWASADQGVPRTAIDGANLIESFTYRAKDNGLVLFLRNWGTNSNPVHNNRLYVSFSNSLTSWDKAHPTDIPDAPSRAQAITLQDGTVLLIGNQNVSEFDKPVYIDRDPMTISVSKDGYTFDKVYAFRTESPSQFRIPGVSGRNPGYAYSSSIVVNKELYTLYSIGKEDMAISKVPLSAMGL